MMILKKRRRREGKTNYNKRLKILKGDVPRIVIRRTNRYIIGQYVKSEEGKDKIIIGVTSKKLLKYGWPEKLKGRLKSIPASYLTGLLFGKLIQNKKEKEIPIIDIGIHQNQHKSRIYSFVKGLVDSGLKIKYNEKIFPDENRINGKHIKGGEIENILNEIKKKI